MSELGQTRLFSASLILVCFLPDNGHYFVELEIVLLMSAVHPKADLISQK